MSPNVNIWHAGHLIDYPCEDRWTPKRVTANSSRPSVLQYQPLNICALSLITGSLCHRHLLFPCLSPNSILLSLHWLSKWKKKMAEGTLDSPNIAWLLHQDQQVWEDSPEILSNSHPGFSATVAQQNTFQKAPLGAVEVLGTILNSPFYLLYYSQELGMWRHRLRLRGRKPSHQAVKQPKHIYCYRAASTKPKLPSAWCLSLLHKIWKISINAHESLWTFTLCWDEPSIADVCSVSAVLTHIFL